MSELDGVERTIIGFIIFLFLLALYFLTEIFVFLAALVAICYGLGFAAEKILDHLEEN